MIVRTAESCNIYKSFDQYYFYLPYAESFNITDKLIPLKILYTVKDRYRYLSIWVIKKKKIKQLIWFHKITCIYISVYIFCNAQLSLIVIIWFHKSSCSLASHAMDWPSIQLVSLPTARASQRSHLGQDGQFGELMEGWFFMLVNKWLRHLPICHHLINLVHRVKTMLFVASLWELLYRVDCSIIHYTYNMWKLIIFALVSFWPTLTHIAAFISSTQSR